MGADWGGYLWYHRTGGGTGKDTLELVSEQGVMRAVRDLRFSSLLLSHLETVNRVTCWIGMSAFQWSEVAAESGRMV